MMMKSKLLFFLSILIHYLLYHSVVFVLIVLIKIILFINTYGLNDSIYEISKEYVSDSIFWLSVLSSIIFLYPLVWILVFIIFYNKYTKFQFALMYSFIGVIPNGLMYLFTSSISQMFFHPTYGSFSIILSFILGSFIYFPLLAKYSYNPKC